MAAKANIVIDQGTDYSTSIIVSDENGDVVDLTGYTGVGQVRKHYTSSTAYDFTITFSANRAEGIVTISMPRSVTANLEAGRYVYDVEITDTNANNTTRLVEGIITVTPEVSRS
jgi:endoglucanase Acf2